MAKLKVLLFLFQDGLPVNKKTKYLLTAGTAGIIAYLVIFNKGKGFGLTTLLEIKPPPGGPEAAKKITQVARGIKNNNPGNISRSEDRWQGLSFDQNDPAYFQFTAPVYGLRALAVVLRNYQRLYNIRTVTRIISRYGPKSPQYAQNVQNYITYTSDYLKVGKDELIDLNNDTTLIKVMQSVVNFENGYNPYSTGKYREAVALA